MISRPITFLGEGLILLVPETDEEKKRGLLGYSDLDDQHGMLFEECSGLHTVGMTTNLDVAWLDDEGYIVALQPNVAPGHVLPARSRRALEVAGGWFSRRGIRSPLG